MEFLIKAIIKRMEDMKEKEGKEVFSSGRATVELDPEKHNQTSNTKRKKDEGCC